MEDTNYLTTREFDSWRQDHDKKVDTIVAFISEQQTRTVKTEGRLTALEIHREHALIGLGIFSSIISAVVGGLVGLAVTFWE
jgi:hypothetical protein